MNQLPRNPYSAVHAPNEVSSCTRICALEEQSCVGPHRPHRRRSRSRGRARSWPKGQVGEMTWWKEGRMSSRRGRHSRCLSGRCCCFGGEREESGVWLPHSSEIFCQKTLCSSLSLSLSLSISLWDTEHVLCLTRWLPAKKIPLLWHRISADAQTGHFLDRLFLLGGILESRR